MSEPTSLRVECFWSFRSPYSYLALPRLVEWSETYALEVELRPVHPIAVRIPDFFATVNPLWPPYLVRDCLRVAEFLGMPFSWPRPDPVVQTPREGRLVTAEEQPYIHRLTRLGQLARERGAGLRFAREVSHCIWSGEVRDWHEGGHLAEAARRAGLELTELDPLAREEAERLDAAIARSEKDHEAAGHWGVPTCVLDGEPFFGQDRLELLLWRLRQKGLRRRDGSPA